MGAEASSFMGSEPRGDSGPRSSEPPADWATFSPPAGIVAELLEFQVNCGLLTSPGDRDRLHSRWSVAHHPLTDGGSIVIVVDSWSWLTRLRRTPDGSPAAVVAALDEIVAANGKHPSILRLDSSEAVFESLPFRTWLAASTAKASSAPVPSAPRAFQDGHSRRIFAAACAASGGSAAPEEWTSAAALRLLEGAMNDTRLLHTGVDFSARQLATLHLRAHPAPIRRGLERWSASRELLFERLTGGTLESEYISDGVRGAVVTQIEDEEEATGAAVEAASGGSGAARGGGRSAAEVSARRRPALPGSEAVPGKVRWIGEWHAFCGTLINTRKEEHLNHKWLMAAEPFDAGSTQLTVVDSWSWMTRLRRLPDDSVATMTSALDEIAALNGRHPSLIVAGHSWPGVQSAPFRAWLSRHRIALELSGFLREESPYQSRHRDQVFSTMLAAGGRPADWGSAASLRRLEDAFNNTHYEGAPACPAQIANFPSLPPDEARGACALWEAARERLHQRATGRRLRRQFAPSASVGCAGAAGSAGGAAGAAASAAAGASSSISSAPSGSSSSCGAAEAGAAAAAAASAAASAHDSDDSGDDGGDHDDDVELFAVPKLRAVPVGKGRSKGAPRRGGRKGR